MFSSESDRGSSSVVAGGSRPQRHLSAEVGRAPVAGSASCVDRSLFTFAGTVCLPCPVLSRPVLCFDMDGGGRGGGRGRGGRRRGNRGAEDRDVRLSKSMSYALRHGANQMGLHISSDGFLFVEDLLAHQQFRSYSLEDVERVVATNDKQRFKLLTHPEDGRLQIRANQGHSIQVMDLELKPLLAGSPDCPAEAVHGSYMRNWSSIQQQGLSRMSRTHIHLAPGLPGQDGVISGMRKDCDLAVFIDVPKALADGIEFFRSENGVLLTAGNAEGKLPPKYFDRALRLRPTRSILPLE